MREFLSGFNIQDAINLSRVTKVDLQCSFDDALQANAVINYLVRGLDFKFQHIQNDELQAIDFHSGYCNVYLTYKYSDEHSAVTVNIKTKDLKIVRSRGGNRMNPETETVKYLLYRVMNKNRADLWVASDIKTLARTVALYNLNDNGAHHIELVKDPEDVQVVMYAEGSDENAIMKNGYTVISEFIDSQSSQSDSDSSSSFAQLMHSSSHEYSEIRVMGIWHGPYNLLPNAIRAE